MNTMIKVCVRVPSDRKEDLLNYAETLRKADSKLANRTPGWDAKAIHKIAKEKYGSLLGMFESHGWTERGSNMMRSVQSRVKQTYGNVEEFISRHAKE